MSYTQRPAGSQARTSSPMKNGSIGPHGEVLCVCNQPAILLETKKEGPNKGRFFYKCANPSDSAKCKFFHWRDDDAPPSSSSASSSSGAFQGQGQRLTTPVTPTKPAAAAPRKHLETDEEEIEWGPSDDESAFASPSKKAKFTSFETPPLKKSPLAADVHADFTARHNALFSPSTPSSPSGSELETTINGLLALMPQLEAVKAELKKKDRLVLAGKKQVELLKAQLEKLKKEQEGPSEKEIMWKKERTMLFAQIKALEVENDELRGREKKDGGAIVIS